MRAGGAGVRCSVWLRTIVMSPLSKTFRNVLANRSRVLLTVVLTFNFGGRSSLPTWLQEVPAYHLSTANMRPSERPLNRLEKGRLQGRQSSGVACSAPPSALLPRERSATRA